MMSLFFILLWDKVIYLSMFYDCHYYLYLFICNYLCIYTPSYQHFKAFPLSKFNTSFLYQLFKENSNVIVKKPCKVICLSAYDVFVFYIYLYIHIYTPSNQHSKAFSVFKINFETSFLYQLFQISFLTCFWGVPLLMNFPCAIPMCAWHTLITISFTTPNLFDSWSWLS